MNGVFRFLVEQTEQPYMHAFYLRHSAYGERPIEPAA
jgi:hypothetical protein